ncbi:MAG: type III polyketide synthase, partial [Planctomycetota bacterium]
MTAFNLPHVPAIRAIGTALPDPTLDQPVAATHAAARATADPKRRRVLHRLYQRSGVDHRRVVLDELTRPTDAPPDPALLAPPTHPADPGPTTAARLAHYHPHAERLLVAAAQNAIAAAQTDPAHVTHLVTASCTGFHAPGVDLALIDRLGLPPTTQRTHVGFMGCHAALNALRVARAFVLADPNAVVLVGAVEVCSIHLAYGWQPDVLVGNALFADGAAAAIVSATDDAEPTPPTPP